MSQMNSNLSPHYSEYTLKPAFPDRNNIVPIVLSSSEAYTMVCSVVIASIIRNASASHNYDIVVLDTGIRPEYQETIRALAQNTSNISIRFLYIRDYLQQFQLSVHDHLSIETFARFLGQSVLPDYQKIVHLDTDIICNHDIAELYDVDIGTNLLAAARDPDMCGAVNLSAERMNYVCATLGLKNPYDYFQAGVLVLNTARMRELYTTDQWLTLAQAQYLYADQDVLNQYCQGCIQHIDMRWNVLNDCGKYRVPVVIAAAPSQVQEEYFVARHHPYIVHYAGIEKPWNEPGVDMEEFFWKYAQFTPYYAVLRQNSAAGAHTARVRKLRKKIKDSFMSELLLLFPKGTRRYCVLAEFRNAIKSMIR